MPVSDRVKAQSISQSGSNMRGDAMHEQEVVLEFRTDDDFGAALRIIFEEKLSHVLLGERTVVVPRSRMVTFNSLKFDASEVLRAADLPPEEVAELRRENLGFLEDK